MSQRIFSQGSLAIKASTDLVIPKELQTSYRTSSKRWIALILICLMPLGEYLCFDFPAFLAVYLKQDLDITQSQYNLLYTVYSMPNIIVPFFAGLFIDKIGIRWGAFIFTLIIVIGQLINYIATLYEPTTAFHTMLVGRVVYGLGAECLSVCDITFAQQWFKGKEMSLAVGVIIASSRLGSSIGSYLFPPLYLLHNNLGTPLLVGLGFCLFSWLDAMLLCWLDKKAQDHDQEQIQGGSGEEETISCSDLKQLKTPYWLITLSCLICYVCLFPFLSNAQTFFQTNWNLAPDVSARIISIPYMIAAGLCPFVGLIVDKIGKRNQILISSICIMIGAYVIFLSVPYCPEGGCDYTILILPFVMLGIFYSFYSVVLWPCVSLMCDSKIAGTAIGVISSIQNIGLASGPIIVGQIIEKTNEDRFGYFWMLIFFIIMGGTTLLVNIYLFIWDSNNGSVLAQPAGKENTKEGVKEPLNIQQDDE